MLITVLHFGLTNLFIYCLTQRGGKNRWRNYFSTIDLKIDVENGDFVNWNFGLDMLKWGFVGVRNLLGWRSFLKSEQWQNIDTAGQSHSRSPPPNQRRKISKNCGQPEASARRDFDFPRGMRTRRSDREFDFERDRR